jgi:hypothetical protein
MSAAKIQWTPEFEWSRSPAKEDRAGAVARDGADAASRLQPTDFETERIAIVPLGALRILDGKFLRGMSEAARA